MSHCERADRGRGLGAGVVLGGSRAVGETALLVPSITLLFPDLQPVLASLGALSLRTGPALDYCAVRAARRSQVALLVGVELAVSAIAGDTI